MGPSRPRELLIGASLVSIEGFLVELQPVPVTMPIITPGPVRMHEYRIRSHNLCIRTALAQRYQLLITNLINRTCMHPSGITTVITVGKVS